jgi:hypothetical protein
VTFERRSALGRLIFYIGDMMPIYSIRNNETKEEYEVTVKLSELEVYLKDNPHLQQIFNKFPGIGDSVRLGIRRPDDNFRDVLKKAKSAHKYSTVNDF